MKPRQNLFYLMTEEIKTAFSALFSVLSGKQFQASNSKSAENVFNYLVYQRRKKTMHINKTG